MKDAPIPRTIAVLDLETTGVFPRRNDRVLELASVVVGTDGTFCREFTTLLNPSRDVGPSSIHGLTSEDVIQAPRFGEIAGSLIEALDGVIAIAAHNAPFDRGFLVSEFARIGYVLPDCRWLCTMHLAGGGALRDCCEEFGISTSFEAHTALADARATAELLLNLLADDSRLVHELDILKPIAWPSAGPVTKRPLRRDEARRMSAERATYLQRILARAGDNLVPCTDDAAHLAYSALLTRALEDRRLEETEADALVEVALEWGLDRKQIVANHRAYLMQLAAAALADGVVSDSERNDLLRVSRLLGESAEDLNALLAEAASRLEARHARVAKSLSTTDGLRGLSVCFTGELQCQYQGRPISREQAESLAQGAGLVVAGSVTKKLDLLVVADPHTQSGKAAKARRYGIRILHEPVFWSAIGVKVM